MPICSVAFSICMVCHLCWLTLFMCAAFVVCCIINVGAFACAKHLSYVGWCRTAQVAEEIWAQTFKYLADQKVLFEGMLLKPSMVTPGADSGKKVILFLHLVPPCCTIWLTFCGVCSASVHCLRRDVYCCDYCCSRYGGSTRATTPRCC